MVNPRATCEDYQGETRQGVNRGLGEVGNEGWGQHREDQHSLLHTRGEVGPGFLREAQHKGCGSKG